MTRACLRSDTVGSLTLFENRRRESDIWKDLPVLYYIKFKVYPYGISDSEKSRIRKRARNYMFIDIHLHKIGRNGSERRIVPPVEERREIVEQVHVAMNHRKEKPMLSYLRSLYFWDRMAHDVRTVINNCPVCQQMKAQHYVNADRVPYDVR